MTKIILIVVFAANSLLAQRDTLINGILFSNELTYTDSIQMGLLKNKLSNIIKKENRLSIYIPVLPFIDLFSGMSYRIGSEVKIYHTLSAFIEAGGFFYKQPHASWLDKVTGGVGKIGLKLYLNKNKETAGKYVAIDYLYKTVKYTAVDSIRIDKNPSFQKEYEVNKSVNAFTIKYGETLFGVNRLMLDLYGGIGIRFISSHKTLTLEEENNILYGEGNGGLTGSAVRATGILPNINVGIKIGYRIRK
jgi:hypothetical protein